MTRQVIRSSHQVDVHQSCRSVSVNTLLAVSSRAARAYGCDASQSVPLLWCTAANWTFL